MYIITDVSVCYFKLGQINKYIKCLCQCKHLQPAKTKRCKQHKGLYLRSYSEKFKNPHKSIASRLTWKLSRNLTPVKWSYIVSKETHFWDGVRYSIELFTTRQPSSQLLLWCDYHFPKEPFQKYIARNIDNVCG